MSKRLFLLGIEHEGASRLPGKPLLPFQGTTLFDILLDKFEALQDSGIFCGVGVALWQGDRKLCARAALRHPGIPIIARSEASVKAHNDLKTQFSFLKYIDADYVLWPNTCAPLLKAKSIEKMGDYFLDLPSCRGLTTVVERRGWLFDMNCAPINHHAASTQNSGKYLKATYNAHVFKPEVVLETGRYWTYGDVGDPALWAFDPRDEDEAMDIDTREDFERAEAVFPEVGSKAYREIVELDDPTKEEPCAPSL